MGKGLQQDCIRLREGMTIRRFIIVSGYHSDEKSLWQPWFHRLWWEQNIAPNLSFMLHEVFVISNRVAYPAQRYGTWIELPGDLGYCGDLIDDAKDVFCPQVVAIWLAGAWLAYASECDLIYVEQDCLCFGDWVGQMYADIGDKGMVFGDGKWHGASTSLFLIRHKFIPKWTKDYINEGCENNPARIPERKMRRLREREPEEYATLSFGYDTDRPFDPEQRTFYIQKTTPQELETLQTAGRLKFDSMPEVEKFSNH